MTDKIIVLTTCETSADADRIGRHLVEGRLAACVTVLPGATSTYRWRGAVETNAELVVLIKTKRSLFDQVSAEIARIHSYEVPEVVALPVVDGSPAYLGWLEKELLDE